MPEVVRIKPHHFVDILREWGAGKTAFTPHHYGHALHGVAASLLADREAILEMELGADDICAPCIHNQGGLCDDLIDTTFRPLAPKKKIEWNLLIDGRWCERLGVRPGERIPAREFCRRVRLHAGEMAEIYREISAEATAERARKVCLGITLFLGT